MPIFNSKKARANHERPGYVDTNFSVHTLIILIN